MIGIIWSTIVISVLLTSSIQFVSTFLCPANYAVFDEDINYYHLCQKKGAESIRVKCPENFGYLNNEKNVGCVSYKLWECTYKEGEYPPDCYNQDNFNILLPHLNPIYYWVCVRSFGVPEAVLMKCPEGTAFTNKGPTNAYGCVSWDKWRCKDRKKYDEL